MLRFLLFAAAAGGIASLSIILAAFAVGTLGIPSRAGSLLASALGATGVLALTLRLLRAQGENLAALGLVPTRRRLYEFGLGFAISVLLFLGVAMAQSRMVDAQWHFQGLPGLRVALIGIAATTIFVVFEELLFRGMGLRYLRVASGDQFAVLFSALVFGAYHLFGTGQWAMGALFQFVMPALGGLVFAWAAVRTDGLALPLGLHLGGNWIQASVVSFTPLTGSETSGVWHVPISVSKFQLLAAPDFAARLPYLLALAITVMVVVMVLRERPRELT